MTSCVALRVCGPGLGQATQGPPSWVGVGAEPLKGPKFRHGPTNWLGSLFLSFPRSVLSRSVILQPCALGVRGTPKGTPVGTCAPPPPRLAQDQIGTGDPRLRPWTREVCAQQAEPTQVRLSCSPPPGVPGKRPCPTSPGRPVGHSRSHTAHPGPAVREAEGGQGLSPGWSRRAGQRRARGGGRRGGLGGARGKALLALILEAQALKRFRTRDCRVVGPPGRSCPTSRAPWFPFSAGQCSETLTPPPAAGSMLSAPSCPGRSPGPVSCTGSAPCPEQPQCSQLQAPTHNPVCRGSRHAPTWDPVGVRCPSPATPALQHLSEMACRPLLGLALAQALGQVAPQAGPRPRGAGTYRPSSISGGPQG
ncbi:transcription initiation factor TFIID subunit 4-like isoform X2 [Herpailurus yagouaroundi]|uniref:transcription initiation factor TFIID subunit 4-like isoform X2 n=1 Tax=Herpailurus yagouaroundi TaxID=1608482 RepID=UPI001AD6E15C|nr:transcription initiation factor TFIID subunit 4-like isoform X2 [Puma yagouaroundi]